ncbi:MAG: glycosyltransferase family 39 protein [Chitinispirillaceae bacterium]|nr:glycosyltransferase family 39 protein [Chitinispirillaceae bacterium]
MHRFSGNIHTIYLKVPEALVVTAILLTAFFLLAQRINLRTFPSGDEGSWMGVAAQLERGEGFTTRWFEHPYLNHPMLPRPDDYRYPGLTLILAAMFHFFGTSYTVGLWTVAALQLIFLSLFYLIIRRLYGVTVACTALTVTSLSLLQIYWNSAVYSEGLFGIGLALITMAVLFQDLSKYRSWAVIGIACGLLYYIRPNGILMLGGLPVYVFFKRKDGRKPFIDAGICFTAFLLMILPWVLRYVMQFGNPLHIAGGASVLRASNNDPMTWSFLDFIRHYGPFIPFRMIGTGIGHFFVALHFFDRNLFILPLAGVVIRLCRKRCRGDIVLAPFYLLTTIACFYISYQHSWAAVRYMAPLLPFIYAYGIAELSRMVRTAGKKLPVSLQKVPVVVLLAVLVAPVYYPHRFYLRQCLKKTGVDRTYPQHRALLQKLVREDGYYLADSYGQLAFLSTRRCVGIQTFVDSTMIPEFLSRYNPALLILTAEEEDSPRIRGIVHEITRNGIAPDPVVREDGATYYLLRSIPPDTTVAATPHGG